eukprot:TRINITY_DN10810_c0_g1_i1.p1 TRINITY_DN10810_c0_g1~~TRINITY_DN10810_c0_g1_i1.p1  ORF type:complete len:427 (+),score=81.73 TRINITY_DN10810_c0_g1_i1:38-1318(+)
MSESLQRVGSTVNLIKPHGRGLPPVTGWPHRPLLFRVASDAPMLCEGGVNLPLNSTKATPFESTLFVGEMLLRIRGVPNGAEDPWSGVYQGKKRTMAVIVQGQFKKRISYNDAKSGFECSKPLSVSILAKTAIAMCKVVQPGLESDVSGPKPYVRNFLAASADALTVSPPGTTPPPIMGGEPPENGPWADKKARRHALRNEETRKSYYFEPGNVYTFGFNSDKLHLLEFKAKLSWPAPDLHFGLYLNGQPFPFQAMTSDGKVLWKFELWHESLLKYAGPEVMEGMGRMGMFASRRKSRMSLPQTESLYSRRPSRPKVMPAVSDDDEDGSDCDRLEAAQNRLDRLIHEQALLRHHMDLMLQTAPRPPPPLTTAHMQLQTLIAHAVERTEKTMKQASSAPFDPAETRKYITLILQNSTPPERPVRHIP